MLGEIYWDTVAGAVMEVKCVGATDDKLQTWAERQGTFHKEIYETLGQLGVGEVGPEFWPERMVIDNEEKAGGWHPGVVDGLRWEGPGGNNENKEGGWDR